MKLPNLNRKEICHYTQIRSKKKCTTIKKLIKDRGSLKVSHINALSNWSDKMREFGIIK